MGGGGKGGEVPQKAQTVYTDPVTGRSFVDDPNPTGFGANFEGLPGFTWQSGANKLNDFITQREQQATTKSAADKAAADQKSATDLASWQQKRDALVGNERNAFTNYFTQQGLDPNAYASDIDSAISGRTSTLQDNADLGGLFPSSMPQDLVNTLTANRQTKNLAGYNAVFNPNYSTSAVSDTWDDPVIDQILGKQFDPLSQSIDLAHKRGQLNDRGVTGALQELDSERNAARGALSGIGNDILSGYRGKLDDYISGGRTAAGSVPLGSNFDLAPYQQHVNDLVGQFQSGLGSDFTNKVGATNYGDINKIMNAGGVYQGPIAGQSPGTATAGVAGDIADSVLDPNKKRVLQTQGQF